MPKATKLTTVLILLGAVLAAVLYRVFPTGFLLSLAITLGTMAYHFLMRLLVGTALGSPVFMRPNYTEGWYRVRPWERKVFRALRVREWKDKMPTYSPEAFSPRLHGWEEIAINMCCSERVHEVSALLSFVPLGASLWFRSFWVFFVTSVLGAAFDMSFAVIQRYNRMRIAKIASRPGARPH